MIQPPYLVRGDKIGIVSPARSITFEEVHPALRFFQKQGLEVVLASHIFSKHNQYAGTDAQRGRDLQQMLDDDSIRAIVCSRGGYGTVRIVDGLDFTRFCGNPKWVVGYSDVTVLHSHIQRQFGIETIHSLMPVNIKSDRINESLMTLMDALNGEPLSYSYPTAPFSKPGQAKGVLTGGNLSILYSLMGSASEIDTDGKILFIEEVDEYLYHIDRMMMSLKRAGKLETLRGLVVGGMSRMNDNAVPFGMAAEQIIASAVRDYSYPVCFGFPAGHEETNLAMILGRNVTLQVGRETSLVFG